MVAERTGRKQRGRPFPKGRSGNPAGRPKGARNKATVLAEQLMADDAENVVRAVVKAAKRGDMAAARIVLDRIVPPRKGRPVKFTVPSGRRRRGRCRGRGSERDGAGRAHARGSLERRRSP